MSAFAFFILNSRRIAYMKLLEDRILKDGKVSAGEVLRVDSFVNHQIDVPFICELGKEFHRRFKDDNITKILTIEASGIGIACLTAVYFGVPVVFAKKTESTNVTGDVYTADVFSYTHNRNYTVRLSKSYLTSEDRVLIIDDFLAKGGALNGLIKIVRDSGAYLCGAGIVVEKAFQPGGDLIRKQGIRVESLARIASMSDEALEFVKE